MPKAKSTPAAVASGRTRTTRSARSTKKVAEPPVSDSPRWERDDSSSEQEEEGSEFFDVSVCVPLSHPPHPPLLLSLLEAE